MPHKKRKVRKKRGSRTHGYGQVGQHRGGGQRGGKGKAGLRTSKHKWSFYVKNASTLFPEKRGFNPPIRLAPRTINVGVLDEQVDKLLMDKQIINAEDGIAVNLNQLGYEKLLGAGKVTHPLIVSVAFSSKIAIEKIREAGGQVICK